MTIRDLLRGPSVVIRLSSDSQLSDAILAYLREHGPEYEQQHHVQVVVVLSSYDGDGAVGMLGGLPNNITVLHVTDALFMDMYRDTVLGGPISPVTLFLDKSLVVTLIGAACTVFATVLVKLVLGGRSFDSTTLDHAVSIPLTVNTHVVALALLFALLLGVLASTGPILRAVRAPLTQALQEE